VWQSLEHPNVLPLYGITSENPFRSPHVSMVCPWQENGNLHNYLKDHDNLGLARRAEIVNDFSFFAIQMLKCWLLDFKLRDISDGLGYCEYIHHGHISGLISFTQCTLKMLCIGISVQCVAQQPLCIFILSIFFIGQCSNLSRGQSVTMRFWFIASDFRTSPQHIRHFESRWGR
jgi:hypothetical protein